MVYETKQLGQTKRKSSSHGLGNIKGCRSMAHSEIIDFIFQSRASKFLQLSSQSLGEGKGCPAMVFIHAVRCRGNMDDQSCYQASGFVDTTSCIISLQNRDGALELSEVSCTSSKHSIGSGAHETYIQITQLRLILLVRPDDFVDCIHDGRRRSSTRSIASCRGLK